MDPNDFLAGGLATGDAVRELSDGEVWFGHLGDGLRLDGGIDAGGVAQYYQLDRLCRLVSRITTRWRDGVLIAVVARASGIVQPGDLRLRDDLAILLGRKHPAFGGMLLLAPAGLVPLPAADDPE